MMRDERGYDITELDCPITFALKSRVQSMRRMIIRGRSKNDVSVNVHTIPVVDSEGTLFGAAILLHDASGEVSLEEQCQDWQARATRDQLTQLANRAEFDRELEKLVKEHIDRGMPCSLIMTDIDRFKSVNDNYGHQVGDEVLVSFSQTLKKHFATEFYRCPLRWRRICYPLRLRPIVQLRPAWPMRSAVVGRKFLIQEWAVSASHRALA